MLISLILLIVLTWKLNINQIPHAPPTWITSDFSHFFSGTGAVNWWMTGNLLSFSVKLFLILAVIRWSSSGWLDLTLGRGYVSRVRTWMARSANSMKPFMSLLLLSLCSPSTSRKHFKETFKGILLAVLEPWLVLKLQMTLHQSNSKHMFLIHIALMAASGSLKRIQCTCKGARQRRRRLLQVGSRRSVNGNLMDIFVLGDIFQGAMSSARESRPEAGTTVKAVTINELRPFSMLWLGVQSGKGGTVWPTAMALRKRLIWSENVSPIDGRLVWQHLGFIRYGTRNGSHGSTPLAHSTK